MKTVIFNDLKKFFIYKKSRFILLHYMKKKVPVPKNSGNKKKIFSSA